MSSKRLISDQVLYRLSGGSPDVSFPVQKQDVWKALEQLVNSMFKLTQFSENLPSGETIPNGLSIATYESVDVSSYGDVSKATLPVIPIMLPKNMGIFDVRPAMSLPNVSGMFSFIPLAKGSYQLLRNNFLLNDLMGQIGYEPRNKDVVFTKNISLLGVTKVDMDLVVMEIASYSETDTLPIPADMEATIIEKLVMQFSTVTPESGQVNLISSAGQQPQNLK